MARAFFLTRGACPSGLEPGYIPTLHEDQDLPQLEIRHALERNRLMRWATWYAEVRNPVQNPVAVQIRLILLVTVIYLDYSLYFMWLFMTIPDEALQMGDQVARAAVNFKDIYCRTCAMFALTAQLG